MCTGAFVCPLHYAKNDFNWGMNLYRSAQRFGLSDNLYFVFSTNEEAVRFGNMADWRGGITT